MGEEIGQLVGLVAELMDRQGPAEGIPAAGRQAVYGAAEPAAQGPGQPGQAAQDARTPEIAVVASEEFIAAITAESHGKAAAEGFPADQMGGELGGIAEGFAVEARQIGYQRLGVGGREDSCCVVSAQVGGHGTGVGRLVEAGLLKADCEGTNRPAAVGLQQGGDQGGSNAAREEGAKRHIGQAVQLQRGAQHSLQGLQASGRISRGLSKAF